MPSAVSSRTGWVVSLAGAAAFGAIDQYLGTVRFLVEFGRWPSTASQVSATWLLLPFLAGCTQRTARSAAAIGLASTQVALACYALMTVSPFEGVALAAAPNALAAMAAANMIYVVCGLATGPAYGWLGYRWRIARSPVAAALVIGALCLEPLVRGAVGERYDPAIVWRVEVALGVAAAVAFAAMIRARRRTGLA
jgi:hypothetical protein